MTPNLNQKSIKEKEGDRKDVITLKMTIRQEIDCLVERETHTSYRGRGRLNQNYSQNYRGIPQDNLGVTIEETIIENKDIDIEVELETLAGILIEIVLGMTIHEVETLVETGVGLDNPLPI